DALSRVEEQMRAQGGAEIDRRIGAAKRRMLTSVQLVVRVGYVALQRGTALNDEQIAELIQARPRRTRQSQPAGQPLEQDVATDATSQLDAATLAAFDTPEADTAQPSRIRPRRRTRELAAADSDDAA